MAHASHRLLSNTFHGARAGDGDPATSGQYAFGPSLEGITVAAVTLGPGALPVVLAVAMVSATAGDSRGRCSD